MPCWARSGVWWLLAFLGTMSTAIAGEVRVVKVVTYLAEGRAEKADLYLPERDGRRHPGIVIIHGGGWIGDQRDSDREVNMYGPVDIENWKDRIEALKFTRAENPELYKAFSVLTYVSADDPPLLTLQGTKDHVTPVSQSQALDAKLAQHGVTHHLEIIEGAGHSFDLQPEQRDLRPLVLAWFDQHLRGKP